MKTFITTSIVLFFAVIAFNIAVDKNFFWHRQNAFEAATLQAGECVNISEEKFAGGNDRLAQRTIRKNMDRPDVVAFSSSRGSYADDSFFPGKKVYNTAVSISLLEDYIDVWVDLKKQNKIPSEAIIFVDGWIFNDAVVNFRSWQSIPGFMTFLEEQNLLSELPPAQKKRYANEEKDRLKKAILNLISFDQTTTAAELLFKGQYKKFDVKPCNDLDDSTYLKWMGAHVSKKITTAEDLEKIVNDKESAIVYMDPWAKSDFLVRVFKVFIKDLIKNNVKVHVVTPLFHPTAYASIVEREAVRDFKSILDTTLAEEPNLNACVVYDAEKVSCENNEFKDAIHMTKSCMGKLLHYCKITVN